MYKPASLTPEQYQAMQLAYYVFGLGREFLISFFVFLVCMYSLKYMVIFNDSFGVLGGALAILLGHLLNRVLAGFIPTDFYLTQLDGLYTVGR